jgi:hypothetical protein
MATVTRQPFAPLDGTRLQNLTSLKNRQNAISSPAGKRKAELVDTDDSENVDPLFFAKRSKGSNGNAISGLKDGAFVKPTNFLLTTKKQQQQQPLSTPTHSLASAHPAPRRVIQPKSPAAKLNTAITKSSNLSAPAGRSPTRGKRAGILSSRRRTGGSYTRVDPPAFNLGLGNLSSSTSAPAPFSLDAALKGTIPSYASKRTIEDTIEDTSAVDVKASWFFDIHEDTPEQEMTNMLQHGTCVLDISSDEETEQKAKRDDREDKENVPPMDDVSQTSRRERVNHDDMMVEKERVSLGELNRADFYAEGCNELSVIYIPADEEEEQQQQQAAASAPRQSTEPIVQDFAFAPQLKHVSPSLVPLPEGEDFTPEGSPEPEMPVHVDIDALMSKPESTLEDSSSKAAVLQPIEGTGESFELWESSSANGETPVVESS